METTEKKEESKKKAELLFAYYIAPKDGGFQLHKLHVEEGVVLRDEPLEDPDAWNQIMSQLEFEFSKKFQ